MNEIVKELMPYLQKLADKLDSSAQVLWQMQMAQAKVIAITIVIEWIVLAVFSVLWIKGVKKFLKWREDRYSNDGIDLVAMFLGVGISGTLVVLIFGCLIDIKTLITIIVNPEYWALQEIIKMVK